MMVHYTYNSFVLDSVHCPILRRSTFENEAIGKAHKPRNSKLERSVFIIVGQGCAMCSERRARTRTAENVGFPHKVLHRNDQLLCLFIIPWLLQTGEQYVCVYVCVYIYIYI